MEFALSMPESALFRPGQRKRILRLANINRLPQLVRRRTMPTSLFAYYAHGLRNANPEIIQSARRQALQNFGLYLNNDWIRDAQPGEMAGAAEETALWTALSTAMWWQRLTENDAADDCRLFALEPAA
jgi:hypothetical protein